MFLSSSFDKINKKSCGINHVLQLKDVKVFGTFLKINSPIIFFCRPVEQNFIQKDYEQPLDQTIM